MSDVPFTIHELALSWIMFLKSFLFWFWLLQIANYHRENIMNNDEMMTDYEVTDFFYSEI